jgi:oligosaccharide repeat unit polymerase
MIEIILLILLFGLITSSCKRLGLFNPFQIYFFIWFFVFSLYYLNSNFYTMPSIYFWLTFSVLALVPTLILQIVLMCSDSKISQDNLILPRPRKFIIYFFIALVLITVPLAYQRATIIVSGEDIFSIYGYVLLRTAYTEDNDSMGIYSRLSLLSLVLTSIQIFFFRRSRIEVLMLIAAVFSALFYVYIGTGRTLVVLLACLVCTPLIIAKRVRAKGIIFFALVILLMILVVSTMTTKGISTDSNIVDNFNSILELFQAYFVPPILAFSTKFEGMDATTHGEMIFRSIIALMYNLELTNLEPLKLVKDYAFVPEPTNVYTVYEPYLLDFGYIGLCIPPLFLILHWWIYKSAIYKGGRWIFIYAASIYPLVMQFFQDQYFGLLAMWFQIVFWYFLFLSFPIIDLGRASRLEESND